MKLRHEIAMCLFNIRFISFADKPVTSAFKLALCILISERINIGMIGVWQRHTHRLPQQHYGHQHINRNAVHPICKPCANRADFIKSSPVFQNARAPLSARHFNPKSLRSIVGRFSASATPNDHCNRDARPAYPPPTPPRNPYDPCREALQRVHRKQKGVTYILSRVKVLPR